MHVKMSFDVDKADCGDQRQAEEETDQVVLHGGVVPVGMKSLLISILW